MTAEKSSLHKISLKSDLRRCRHCESEISQDRTDAFCCDGCQAVFNLLQAKDLGEFYEVKGREHLRPVDALGHQTDFSTLDLPENRSAISPDGSRIDFFVEDLSCSACVWILDRLETVSNGILWSRVNLSRSIVTVAKAPDAKFSDIASLIRGLGFKGEPVAAESNQELLQRKAQRRGLIRTGILAALTGNIMLLSVSIYGGADGRMGSIFQWVMAALTLPVVTWGAWPLYLNTWRSLRTRRLSLDVPIAVAVLAGFASGVIGLITGSDLLYFDSVAMLVFLLMASRTALELLKQRFASVDTVPQWLLQTVLDPDSGIAILPNQIEPNQRFTLLARQRLPVDAVVQASGLLWDVSVVTGEARPHESQVGETLAAGSVLISETATLTSKGRVQDSRISKLLQDWRDGQRDRKGLSTLSDQVGQIFTFIVLGLAIILVGYEVFVGFETGPNGWIRALALLLAACPCVFGIGIPLAENLVMQGLSRQGLIVREPSFLQKLKSVRRAFFDKTGTLTTGRLKLTDIEICSGQNISEELVLQWAEALEREDAHPIARAICTEAHRRKIRPVESLEAGPLFHTSKTNRLVGRKGLIRIGNSYTEFQIEALPSDRLTVLKVRLSMARPATHRRESENSSLQTLAIFSLQDEIRSGARELLEYLQPKMTVGILSGDKKSNVEVLSKELSISANSAIGGLRPDEKAKAVESLNVPSFMLGDGANDAEALKRSFASTALKGDLSVCLEAADSVLVVDSLQPLLVAFKMADRLQLTLMTTLMMSASINVLAATLAATGVLTPMIAAILMPTSGFIVTTTTWLMLRRSPKGELA